MQGRGFDHYLLDQYKEANPKLLRFYWGTYHYLRHFGRIGDSDKEIQKWLDSIGPRRCFTYHIGRWQTGFRLPPNTTTFGTHGGDYIMPLKGPRKWTRLPVRKKWIAGFVGMNTCVMRETMFNKLDGTLNWHFEPMYDMGDFDARKRMLPQYKRVMSESYFALAPVGFCPLSYRFYEAFDFDCVPVLIYNDTMPLAYSDILDWSRYAVICHAKWMHRLKEMLTVERYWELRNNALLDGIPEMLEHDYQYRYIMERI